MPSKPLAPSTIDRISHEEVANEHYSFIAVKPDGVQRGLVGEIISRFEKRGFKLVAIKLTTPSKEHLEKHYADLSDKPFFKGLVTCTSLNPDKGLRRNAFPKID